MRGPCCASGAAGWSCNGYSCIIAISGRFGRQCGRLWVEVHALRHSQRWIDSIVFAIIWQTIWGRRGAYALAIEDGVSPCAYSVL